MKTKKTWFSYPFWLVYAVLTGMSAAVYLLRITHIWGLNEYWAVAVIVLVFRGLVGIRSAGQWLVRRIDFGVADKRLPIVLEGLLVLGLCTAAALYRLYLVSHFGGDVDGGALYDIALVKAGGSGPWAVKGVYYVYTSFLAFVLSFTGNKVAAGVMLQLVLQVAAIFFFYFAVKLLAGRGEAMCALAVMAFAPGFCSGIFLLTPEMLYFLLYVFGLLLCGLYGKMVCSMGVAEEGIHNRGRYVWLVVCGLYIGYVGFLDVIGWTLLIPAAGAFLQGRAKEGGKTSGTPARFVACVSVSVAAVFLFLGISAATAGYSYGEALSAWLAYLHLVWEFTLPGSIFLGAGADTFSWMGLFISLCGIFNIIGFRPWEKQQQDSWVILSVLFLVFHLSGFGSMGYGCFLTTAGSILAGMGICSMGKKERGAEAEKRCAQAEERSAQAEERSAQAEKKCAQAEKKCAQAEKKCVQAEKKCARTKKYLGKMGKNLPEIGGIQAGKGYAGSIEEREEELMPLEIAAEEPQEEKPKVKFIENPLPLPKKHVKREMTYAKDVEEEEMDFDVSIEENDDFDI